jgi:hypothetical protein
MSYSIAVANQDDGIAAEKALKAAFEAAYPEPLDAVKKAVLEAIAEVEFLVSALSNGPYNVSITGHAKTGDEDTAEEYVQLRISRASVEDTAELSEAPVEAAAK